MKKYENGFVASLDAIFALFVAVGFIFIILSLVSEKISSFPVQLERQGTDILTVLEKEEAFGSPSAIFNRTSDSLCARLEVFNGTSNTTDSVEVKVGCPSSSSDERILWRTSIYGGVLRTAKVAVWTKS